MKVRRQRKILEIIENTVISTQEELADALRRAGFDVTQATVSRDIKELRLVKVAAGDNNYCYGVTKEQSFAQNEERMCRMMRELVTGLDFTDDLIVLRTYPGNAHTIASLIDGANWEHIIGTVAGDDTILLIVKPREEVERLVQKLKSLMG